jgi:hypothetical protein
MDCEKHHARIDVQKAIAQSGSWAVLCRVDLMNPRITRFLAFAAATMLACGGSARAHSNGQGSPSTKAAATGALNRVLVSDMSQPSERMPQGVPAWYDWATHPRVHAVTSARSFRAFTAWGQLYQCAGTSASRRETVQLRDMQTWVLLRGSNAWRRIQSSSELQGAAFAEDYAGPSVPADYVAKANGTAVRPVARRNFHFWPSSGRVSLDPARVAAVVVAVQARLLTRPTGPAQPCLVLSVGGDLWRSLRAEPGGSNSADIGIGRFKRVERRWRLFTMTTASAELLDRVPLRDIAPAGEDF